MEKLGFPVTYGRDIAGQAVDPSTTNLIVTMEEIWPVLSDYFDIEKCSVIFIDSMEIDLLESIAAKWKGVGRIIGVGGGRAADAAKFIHWKNGIPLCQVPTIMSVDAFYTHEVAIRDNGVVKYVGDAVPEMVFVDYGIIQTAPILLNRSGLGDIISCHTGLFDWKHSAGEIGEPHYDEEMALKTREVLNHVYENIDEISKVSEAGVRTIMDILNWIGHYCYELKHPRFEEGSEHHVAYNMEFITGGHYVHGQLVCLGIYIMSMLQDNEPDKMADLIKRSGIDISLESMDISWEDMEKNLVTLKDFVLKENLPFTIVNTKKITSDFINMVKVKLQEL